jgi:hypothetical protein
MAIQGNFLAMWFLPRALDELAAFRTDIESVVMQFAPFGRQAAP